MTQNITALYKGTIYGQSRVIPDGILLIEDKTIKAVGSSNDISIPSDANKIDAKKQLICPGFIDIHVHGGGGRDTMDGSYEALNEMSKAVYKLEKMRMWSFAMTT